MWVFKQAPIDTKERQEVPRVEEGLEKDAVSRLFSSNYTTRTLPTKTLEIFGNFK
jgi:hypothetical protein